MKEIEANNNIKPEVPDVFIKAFTYGFEIPKPETEIDQMAARINREFIARRLNWRDWTSIMCE